MKKIILGIDPGSRVTGFGVIEVQGDRMIHRSHGILSLSGKEDLPTRLMELGEGLKELLATYQPNEVVIEKIFLGKNADSAFKLGHARGVIMYESQVFGARVLEYATRAVKKSVTGSGSATKEDVQFVIQNLLALKTISKIDASDALAMACHRSFELRKELILAREAGL